MFLCRFKTAPILYVNSSDHYALTVTVSHGSVCALRQSGVLVIMLFIIDLAETLLEQKQFTLEHLICLSSVLPVSSIHQMTVTC